MKTKKGWFILYSNNWLHNINYIEKTCFLEVLFWITCKFKPAKLIYNNIEYDVQELCIEPSDGCTIGKWQCIIYGSIPKEIVKNKSLECNYYRD